MFWVFVLFVRSISFRKKNILVWNCLDSLLYYTTDRYPLNAPIKNLFVRTYFYLWSCVTISSFYENLFESFLPERIYFFSLYENKQAYEYHRLKRIFCHQKQIMIFCWFHMFRLVSFYVFCFKFFSFCTWLFSC